MKSSQKRKKNAVQCMAMLFYSNNINIGLMLNAMHFFSPLTTASEAVCKMGVWRTSTEISQALNNKTLQQMDGNLRKPAMSPSHPGTCHTEITVQKGGEGSDMSRNAG